MKIDELFKVRDLVTIVTGGASGIGRACVEAMSENGAIVVIMDRDATGGARVARELTSKGARVAALTVDATDRPALEAAMADVRAKYGRIDVVFANAGISGGPGFLALGGGRDPKTAFEGVAGEVWERVLRTNVISVAATIAAAIPHLKANGGGRIIVTSSVSAFRTEPHVASAYVASKGAVGQIVRQAAFELAGYDINVNALAPGPTATNIGGGRLQQADAQKGFGALTPMRRIAMPDDMKGAALFLASPASAYVTGLHLFIDGGGMLGTAD